MRPKDEEVFERDGFKCVYCDFDGREFKNWAFLQVDHFVPRSLGGSDEADNLVTSCIICNHMKGAKEWPTIEEARREIATWWTGMRGYWEANVKARIRNQQH